jgi:hypothetical protein
VILTWSVVLAVLALGVIGFFFWSWLRPQMNRRPAVTAEQDAGLPVLKHSFSQFKSPTEEAALELVKQALAVRDPAGVARYFRPGSAESGAVVAFLKDMEKADGAINGFQWLSSMDANGLLIDGVLVNSTKDGAPRSRLAMLTPDEKGIWKIDFDAFARTVKPSWGVLLGEGDWQGVVRVIVARDSYFNGPFRDEAQWVCYGMASPDTETILLGYCREGSPQARAMERIVSEEKDEPRRRLNRVTLEIRRPQGAEIRQFEITRVLAEDWVMAAAPFDVVFK